MSTLNYQYEVGEKFAVEVTGFTQDENGNPAYETSFGAIREEDLSTLEKFVPGEVEVQVKEVEKLVQADNNVMLLITRQNDLDFQEKHFFDNWLDAYKEMFNSLIKDFTAEEAEKAMSSSQFKINQYSAFIEREEGKFIYQIIKLAEG